MLNFFKNSKGGQSGKENLQPPKNLPELARDMYERDVSSPVSQSSQSSIQNIVQEPNKNSVPQLDLSLVRQNLAPEFNKNVSSHISSTQAASPSFLISSNVQTPQAATPASYNPYQMPQRTQAPISQVSSPSSSINVSAPNYSASQTQNNLQNISHYNQSSQQAQQPFSQQYMQPSSQQFSPSNVQQYSGVPQQFSSPQQSQQLQQQQYGQQYPSYGNNYGNYAGNLGVSPSANQLVIDSALSNLLNEGFFKEFEEHLQTNGLNNDIVDDLMNRNLLDNMVFYHNTKSEIPFYTSGAELSHAIKIKLEDLQSLEKSWINNKQKLELLKKFSSAVEYDVNIRSEELKKLIAESKRRGVSVKPSDFFQIVKSKDGQSDAPLISPSSISPGPDVSSSSVSNSSVSNSSVSIGAINRPLNNTPLTNIPLTISVTNPLLSNIHTVHPATSSSNSSSGAESSSVQQHVLQSMEQQQQTQKYRLGKYFLLDQSKYFYAKNGQVFKSMADLINGLKNMDDSTFSYHVVPVKNDFSNWIKGVFNDIGLSESIKPISSKNELLDYLTKTFY